MQVIPSSTDLVSETSMSRPQSIQMVHAEMHCNVDIVAQDRSWFHASKLFQDVIPQIEFDFLIQLDIHQWDVDYCVSCLILLKKKQVVLHHRGGIGSLIDCNLLMPEAVAATVKGARPIIYGSTKSSVQQLQM